MPEVSWLFFKAVRAGLAVKHPYLSHTGRSAAAEEKQPTGPGPEGRKAVLLPRRRYANTPTRSPRDLQVPAAFLLLKARFFKVEQELESSQHGIADGPAISQVDQSSPLYSNQFALERN